MDKKTETIMIVGGLAVAGYLLLKSSGSSIVTPITNLISPANAAPVSAAGGASPVIPGAPLLQPLIFNNAYYLQYQYPALLQVNPGLSNPNYQLSATDAQNYRANYLELQQWFQSAAVVAKYGGNLQAAMQYHWTTYGVAMQYSFVPFIPPKNVNWTPPPANPKSSGSSSIISTVGEVASIAAMFLGPPTDTVLNDGEISLVVTSAAIIKKILPIYLDSQKALVISINDKLDSIIQQYQP